MWDYQFKLDLNTGGTGFNRAMGHSPSCYPNSGPTETEWVIGGRVTPSLIRCGLGQASNSGMTLKGQRIGTNREFTVKTTGSIKQGWHRHDRHVSYRVDLDTIDGIRPSYVSSSFDYRTDTESEIPKAVETWNNASGRTLIELSTSLYPDVKVRAYWFTNIGDRCGQTLGSITLGCVREDRGTTTVYPHNGDLTMWIKHPPQGWSYQAGAITQWTTDAGIAGNPQFRQTHFYLPQILEHEFGHTFGLGHPPEGNVMGPYEVRHPVESLTGDDKHGMREVLRTHNDP